MSAVPPPRNKGCEDAGALASDLRRCVSAFVRSVRAETGTTRSAQSDTLELLHDAGPLSVAAMAGLRGVTHQTMRVVVAQLDAAGLITQTPDPLDKRSRSVAISADGNAVRVHQQMLRTNRIEEAIRKSLSPGEVRALRTAIGIVDRLSTSM